LSASEAKNSHSWPRSRQNLKVWGTDILTSAGRFRLCGTKSFNALIKLWLLFCGLPLAKTVVIVADAVLIVLVSLTRLLKLPWQSFCCGTALYFSKTDGEPLNYEMAVDN